MNNKIQHLVKKIGCIFKEKHFSLVTAESCTGGGLAYCISKDPDSSAVLERGYITYSYQAKGELLNVKPETLQMHGAVSKQTAIEMAEGALSNSKAHVSISITGIAGCDESPKDCNATGTVWMGCAVIDKKTTAVMRHIAGDREEFINQTIEEALNFLLKQLT